MEAERLVNTLADILSETDVKRSGDGLENVKTEQLTRTLTDTLENTEIGTLSEKHTGRCADQDSGQNAGF